MSSRVLIDAIVQQTTVLLAQLATAQGTRAPIAHLASQVFVNLSEELERQGLSKKVSADMFGMALRAYQRKVKRLREETTERVPSTGEKVVELLATRGELTLEQLIKLTTTDSITLQGVLVDLVREQHVERIDGGGPPSYRIVSLASGDEQAELQDMIAAIVFSRGEIGKGELVTICRVAEEECDRALASLVRVGMLEELGSSEAESSPSEVSYTCPRLELPMDREGAWQAALFDHFQAVATTMISRVAQTNGKRDPGGCSTYHFGIWDGHPLQNEVLQTLDEVRGRLSRLRAKVEEENSRVSPGSSHRRVSIYVGQVSQLADDDGSLSTY